MKLTRRKLFAHTLAGYAGTQALEARAAVPAAPDSGWLKDVFRELHLDAHFGQVPAPYADFRAEAAAQILSDAGFQMVSFFAVCGAGYSYYPSRIGVPHPGLKRDFTGEMAAALKKRGIRVLPYVSAGPDRRFHKDHPDWVLTHDPAGNAREMRGDTVQMCLNSPWVEESHIPQLKELVDMYDVDGFFLDALLAKFTRGPCYCEHCREKFAREVGGEIPISDKDPKVLALHRWLTANMAAYADKVTAALATAKPDLAFVFTHVWVTRNPVPAPASVNQLVWEPAPPYPGVHSLDFSLEARYLATQSGIANWSCMATRGNGWGDYSLRDPLAFQHEAAVLLASSGRPYLADDSYPSGNPDPAVYRVYSDINRRTRQFEPYVNGCTPVKEVAVLLSADSLWANLPLVPPREWWAGPSSPAVGGAHKALTESHVPFGILNSRTLVRALRDYGALILPEQCVLGPDEIAAIRDFVRGGGGLLVTGETGVRDTANQPLQDFALADVLGVRRTGLSEIRRAYLRVPAGFRSPGIPRMDIQVRAPYTKIQATTAETLMQTVPPFGAKQAPAESPDGPCITLNRFGKGRAIYCALPVFEAYHREGTSVLRRLAAWMLEQVHPEPARTLLLENAPLNVEVTYNSRGQDRFVHLLNYTGDKRLEGPPRLQDFSEVRGIRVRLRLESPPRQVVALPVRQPVAFAWKNGWTSFEAQPLVLHSAYQIQT